MFSLYKARQWIACLLPACLVVIVIYTSQLQSLQIKPVYDDSTVEIALMDAAELLAAVEPTPEPPPPEPETPLVEPEVVEPVVIEPPKPKPVVKPRPPAPKPVVVKQAPAPAATAAIAKSTAPVPAPVITTAAPKPATTVATAAAEPSNAALESVYTTALRNELEKHKQYPSSREASLQRPHGDVVIWLEVDRAGNVLNSGIESKAPNMLLNRAAQTSLRRVEKVSPFPSDAFSGKDKQRFTATFSYNLE
ncbi:energy transducer TonB [Pseudomonas sp. FW306-02-F02-AA]|uniref:Energy transducer TonB n=1 Tax=Pseudomonas fluorescens TaxID=294 RepID=A0A0N9WC51_PSEFL|nr:MULTISPECIES: energy transducer TonB [Pseudomonas]ALI00422.1 energy transducer TonB [Pseudomonas fluorescens]PMZ01222.1 energy transducer TonB [Pseudomonas sp. FW306-02-F02-AB]PMZ07119.1 energy transducer TonB [Pseudomonas sp. FW306-02-H06C]PMZ16336.1 energy transducer TonB [Pseudomonas sp. FW306-02-F02-AA]PMZ22277.1 energy transducer TonB [Pseudomonas sp. FW306-02-F08-AA]